MTLGHKKKHHLTRWGMVTVICVSELLGQIIVLFVGDQVIALQVIARKM